MHILVTGGAGYIGSTLIGDLLKKGHYVTCVDVLKFGKKPILQFLNIKNFIFAECDINEKDKFEKILSKRNYDSLIRLAAIVGDPACNLYSKEAKLTNLETTKWLIDQCLLREINKFIFASTCSNYGKSDNPEDFLDENSRLAPVSLHAELKVEIENYILNSLDRNNNFSPTILRFSTVYGLSPRMRFDLTVNEFTKELSLNRTLEVYGGQFWRPYCHVRDFSLAIDAVLESDVSKVKFNVFNVGSTSENYTKKMLVELISTVIKNPSISFIKKDEDPRDYKVSCDKIRNQLGFEPKNRVIDGIKEIYEEIISKRIHNLEDQNFYNIPIQIEK